ncbi:oxidoreductase [Aspergillus sergii]|uniref:Oxidoreductase n=1 Tax=Aspergillus sergii TaxID=1034303 RepID=A0A5N6WU14_9EURO|nr:oxidoreductase [Aspergillus sergii]
MAKKYQVGVIGYGLSAKIFQIPFIEASNDFELGAIVQRLGGSAAQDHPEAKIYRAPDDLFNDEAIDVVVVSTPPSTHFTLASAALNAGKHVIVEKPFCPSIKECNDLIALAESNQRILTVFQNRRWDADYVTLHDLLKQGVLGRIVEFDSHFDRFDPVAPTHWAGKDAPGGGVIYDLGTHLFDQILHSFGLPRRITSIIASQRANAQGPGDACTVLLQYESGMLATIKATAMSPLENQKRFCVRGDKGSFIKYHLDPQEEQLAGGLHAGNPGFGEETSGKAGTLVLVKDGALHASPYPNLPPPTYTAFYDMLSDALAGKGDVPVSARDARNVIRLVELAQESSERGVTISINPEEFK